MVGMSPKKAYEVTRMATYVSQIAKNLRVVDGFYIVDVGAGQGHLARELLDVVTGVKGVLALDGDTVLVKRQASVQHPKPRIGVEHATDETDAADATSVTHKFGHITSPERLVEAVDEWFTEMETGHTLRSNIPKPVMLVSLHGCGSLSLDVLRAFVEKRFRLEDIQRGRRRWGFIASVTVPCCYNLLREGEYPVSAPLSPSKTKPEIEMAKAALHFTIIPSTTALLAVRKVVWRALLECLFVHKGIKLDDMDASGRLGRFPPRAYDTWTTFLNFAGSRLGSSPESINTTLSPTLVPLARALSILYVLRCMLGPLVEAALLEDRVRWVRERLASNDMRLTYNTLLVPLFSQLGEVGSARNIAVVVIPEYIE
ncbi:hypothetical protein J3R30DRAFT_3281699 [Lentinula aciculospora]|uniref:Methyltransferase domain-containing protein n=1 Tax=Lentinula aciculospora TaxID=153920 RepID=A0A9W9AN14_9AGAR|nr:hypothetical protein J3R30DRAFT_3281699 [Lentinula aciculospora]